MGLIGDYQKSKEKSNPINDYQENKSKPKETPKQENLPQSSKETPTNVEYNQQTNSYSYSNSYSKSSSTSKNTSQSSNNSNVQESENLQQIKGGLNQDAYNQVLINAEVEASKKGQKVILDYNVGGNFYTIGTGEKYEEKNKKLPDDFDKSKMKLSKDEIFFMSNETAKPMNKKPNWDYQKPSEENSLLSQMGFKTKDKNKETETRPQTSTNLKVDNSYTSNVSPKKSDVFFENEKYKVGGSVIDVISTKNINLGGDLSYSQTSYREKNITPQGTLLSGVIERGSPSNIEKSPLEVNKKGDVLINEIWVGKDNKTYSDSYFLNAKSGNRTGEHLDVQRLDYAFNRMVESGTITDKNKSLPVHNFATDIVGWTKGYYEGTTKIQKEIVSPSIALGFSMNPVGITINSLNYLDNLITGDKKGEGLFDSLAKTNSDVGYTLGEIGGGFYKTMADILPKTSELYIRSMYEGGLSKDFLEGKLKRTEQDKTNVNIPLVNVKFDLPKEMVDFTFLTGETAVNTLVIGGGFYSGVKSAISPSLKVGGSVVNAYFTAGGIGAGIGTIGEGITYLNNPSEYSLKEGINRVAYASGSMAGYVGVAHLSALAGYSTTKGLINAPSFLKSTLFETSVDSVPIQAKSNIGGKLNTYQAYMEVSTSKSVLGYKLPFSDSYTYAGSMTYSKTPNSLFTNYKWYGDVGSAYNNPNIKIKGFSLSTPMNNGKSDFISITKKTTSTNTLLDNGIIATQKKSDYYISRGTSQKTGKFYNDGTKEVYNVYQNIGESGKIKINYGMKSDYSGIEKKIKIVDLKSFKTSSYDLTDEMFKVNGVVSPSKLPSNNFMGGGVKLNINEVIKSETSKGITSYTNSLIPKSNSLIISESTTKLVPLSKSLSKLLDGNLIKTDNNIIKNNKNEIKIVNDGNIIKIDNLPKITDDLPIIKDDEIPPPPSETNLYNVDNTNIRTNYNFNFPEYKIPPIPPVVLPLGSLMGGGGGGSRGRGRKDNMSRRLFTLKEALNLGKTSSKNIPKSKNTQNAEKYVGNFAKKSRSLSEVMIGGKRK